MTDIKIINSSDYDSLETMIGQNLLQYNPCIYIVRSPAEEAAVLAKIRIIDDVCLAEKQDSQLNIRISRLEQLINLGQHEHFDTLTGTKNRRRLTLDLDLIARHLPGSESISLILADIDHFKKINDMYGHSTGDEVLKTFAGILTKAAKGASVYRYGGEEFLIIYKGGLDQGTALAGFIRTEVEQAEFFPENQKLQVTASFGVASESGNFDPMQLINRADQSLYEAKSLGRNRVASYESFVKRAEDQSSIPEIMDFENRMKITTDRLVEYLTIRNRQAMQHIKHLADLDGLTGLYVRRYFDERIVREYDKAVKHKTGLSLIFMDLDHFGRINKDYGFPTGDKTLASAALVMQENVRSVDWLARYGGEEFCVILPDTALEEALAVAERIHASLKTMPLTNAENDPFSITASFGVGQLASSGEDLPAFIKRVSDYTRKAKELGRDRIYSS